MRLALYNSRALLCLGPIIVRSISSQISLSLVRSSRLYMATESSAAMAMEEPGVVVNGSSVVSWVASGVVLWSTAFLLVRALFPKRSYDFCNRAVSTMHAVAAVCLACLSVADWSCPVCPLAAASSPRQVYL